MEYFVVKKEGQIIAESFSDDATKVAEFLAQQPTEFREGARIEKVTDSEMFSVLLNVVSVAGTNINLLTQRVQYLENYINNLKERTGQELEARQEKDSENQ